MVGEDQVEEVVEGGEMDFCSGEEEIETQQTIIISMMKSEVSLIVICLSLLVISLRRLLLLLL